MLTRQRPLQSQQSKIPRLPSRKMHRQILLSLLYRYRTPFVMEAALVHRIISFVENNPDCFKREAPHGHITGSAWVINPGRDKVVLLHHRKHDRWFQPGGHADGETDVMNVALRETREETGLPAGAIKLLDRNIFDVDIHFIPPDNNTPGHQHYDIRFLLEADDRLPLPGNDESYDIAWVPLHNVLSYNGSYSTYRMVEKTRRMFSNTSISP